MDKQKLSQFTISKEELRQLAESVKTNGVKTHSGLILPQDLEFVVQEGSIYNGQKRADRYPQIGITGHSGGGKTTLAEFIAMIFELVAFEGDNITFHAFADPRYREITKKIFNIGDDDLPGPGDDALKWLYDHYLPITFEKDYAMFQDVLPFLEEQLKLAYRDPTMDFGSHPILGKSLLYHPKESGIIIPNGFVMEVCGYHKANTLKRRLKLKPEDRGKNELQTDFLVQVWNSEKKRREMLFNRPNNAAFRAAGVMDEVIDIREAVQDYQLDGIETDDDVGYAYTKESLVLCAEKIIRMMIGTGIVRRKENRIERLPVHSI